MHTMSTARTADGILARGALLALAAVELAAAFALYAIMLAVACQQRVRERRALAALDDRMLRDIGISRADAERETSKPFWHI